MVAALGKRDRNRNKSLPTEAPPTKKNKITRPSTPTPGTSARMQIQNVPGIPHGNRNSSSFSWDSVATTTPDDDTPNNNHGLPQTFAEHPPPPSPAHLDEAVSPAESPPVPPPLASGLNHTSFSLETPPLNLNVHPNGMPPSSSLQVPGTPTGMVTILNPPNPNIGTLGVSMNPSLGQPPVTLEPSTNLSLDNVLPRNDPAPKPDQDPLVSQTPFRSSYSQDVTCAPGAGAAVDHAQVQGAPRLKHPQLADSSFSWDHSLPTPSVDAFFQSPATKISVTPGIAHGGGGGSSNTTMGGAIIDEVLFPVNTDDPAPTTTGRSPAGETSDSNHETDAMEVEQILHAGSLASLDCSSFRWDDVPLTRDPGSNARLDENDTSQPFRPRPPSPPQNSLPPGPAVDAMEVEQLPPARQLANLNGGSFCWGSVLPTRNPGGNVQMEGAPPQSLHTTQRASFTGDVPPVRSADAMEVESLSPASTLMNLDRGSFYWSSPPRTRGPGEDIHMEDGPAPPPAHARPLSPPRSLPSGPMELERPPAARPLANLNNDSFCWDNTLPTHNPGTTHVEERPGSKPSHPPAHSIPGPSNRGNPSSALDPSDGHTPLPQTRSGMRPPVSQDPYTQTRGTNVNVAPAPGKSYYPVIDAEH